MEELDRLRAAAENYVRTLCVDVGNRRTGSEGNRSAAGFVAAKIASFGFEVETQPFDCMDWMLAGGVSLLAGGRQYEAFASPYSPGCRITAPLAIASTVEELEALEAHGKILLLRGEIAAGQLMPKNFPWYRPEEHLRIIRALEAKQPAGIVAATGRDASMACAQYPFPLIEDGDFDIPSAYVTDVAGEDLAGQEGRETSLAFDSRRVPSIGWNVVARKMGRAQPRAVFVAHVDAKAESPGASDNAGGVAVLLLLAELCADYGGDIGLELVAMNGEDYYSNPGEQVYLAQNAGSLDDILIAVNIDGAGYYRGDTAYSLYNCPPGLRDAISSVLGSRSGMVEGEPWYQGDHALFAMNGRPALAVTSELATELVAQITHSPKDTPDILDCGKLAALALALRELVSGLERALPAHAA